MWQRRGTLATALVVFLLLLSSGDNYADAQAAAAANNQQMHRRFEYKHSFRAPNLAQRDGTIPFWIVTGDAIASNEQLRLAPSIRSRKGIAWNKRPFTASESFEAECAFKVTGQRLGADGFAIWYTSQQGTLGPVFGANDYWNGMAIFADSFDNDGNRAQPSISVMTNDGSRSFSHQTDGSSQVLAGCQRDYRNKPFPVHMRIKYFNNVLSIDVSDGLTQQPRYEPCLRVENVFLPPRGFFGISAATGGLADDHDVVDFSVYSLTSGAQRNENAIPTDERQKYDAEFERQMSNFEEERKKFKEQHPDQAKDDDDDPSRYYEDVQARELRLIHESQAQIYTILQSMEQKLNTIQSGGGSVQPRVDAGGGAGAGIQQHEKNEILQTLRDLTSSLRSQNNYVNEIYTRTYNIENKLSAGGNAAAAAAVGSAASSGTAGLEAQLRNYMESVQGDLRQIRATQLATQPNSGGASVPAACPNVACTSSTVYILITLLQTGVILVFVFLRSKSDKAKFY